jgi:hypothetical protein
MACRFEEFWEVWGEGVFFDDEPYKGSGHGKCMATSFFREGRRSIEPETHIHGITPELAVGHQRHPHFKAVSTCHLTAFACNYSLRDTSWWSVDPGSEGGISTTRTISDLS